MILHKFPKTQPTLPEAYQKIYVEHYKSNRDRESVATSMSGKLEEWMHRQVARPGKQLTEQRILEIGAGTLNHLKYEQHVVQYDVVEPFKELFQHAPQLKQVSTVYDYVADVPTGNKYDRIISIAVLEHLCELPLIVAQACLLLKEGGVFSAGIPSEGEFLWKLAYTMTTGVEFKRKYGLDYSVMMNYEHVNTADDIGAVLQYFFKDARRRLFGIMPALSLYQAWECRNPDMERVLAYLKEASRK